MLDFYEFFMNSAVERKILEMKLPDFLTRTSRMIVIIKKKLTTFIEETHQPWITWHMLQPGHGVSQGGCFSNCTLSTAEP